MDHRAALILAASLLCGSVHAGYAQLAPPSGWTGGGGAAATFSYPSAANAATLTDSTVRTNAALNVGGRAVQVPASMRLAANAPRIAAAAIYLHPGLRAIAAVAAWTGAAGFVYNVATGLWERLGSGAEVSDGFEYGVDGVTWYPSRESACSAATIVSATVESASLINSGAQCEVKFHYNNSPSVSRSLTMNVGKRASPCPAGWYKSPAGCTQAAPTEPVTKEDFVRMVPDARPMPPDLPGVVWPASWPVEAPEIQPMFIPTGNPVKNPAYDPAKPTSPQNQPWLQPGVKLSPAPTPSSPWNVDLQPVNRPVDNPNPSPDPVVDPVPNPDGSGDTDKPRDPEKDQRDLCEKYPDIIACQKLEAPEDNVKLPVKEVDFNFAPESGYAGSAVCPPPIVVSVAGETISISWQPFCDSLNMIRPMMLAMAWLMAAFILIGRR